MENQTVQSAINWDDVMIESDYTIATKLLEVFDSGDMEELRKGLKRLIKNAVINAEGEIMHHLKELMENILIWKYCEGEPTEAQYRTQERREKIYGHRSEMEILIESDPCLSEQTIRQEWADAFEWAIDLAELYVPKVKGLKEMTWEEVIEEDY